MNKIKVIIYLLIFIISCKSNRSNNVNSKKINTLHRKAIKNKDSLLYYIKQAKKIITNTTVDTIKAENNFLYGYYFSGIKNKDSSLYYYNKAISYSKDSITRKREKVYHRFLIESYFNNNDFLNVLGALNKFEKLIISQKNNYKYLAYVNDYKQSVYFDLKKYDTSLYFNKKAIENYILIKDTVNLINGLIFQAKINYNYLNNKKLSINLLDSLSKLDINSQENFYLKHQIFYNYAEINFKNKNYKRAYTNYLKSINFIKKSPFEDDIYLKNLSYEKTAESLIKLKKYKLAKQYLDSVKIFKKHTDTELINIDLLNRLELSFKTNKDFNLVKREYDSLSNYILKEKKNRINKDFIALKESNLKEKELLISNQKHTIEKINLKRNQLLLFLSLGLGLLFTILFFRHKKVEFTKNKIFMKQRLFRSQMNPHFTSNILINIQDLIYKDTKLADQYLLKFSRLLRLTLENSMEDYVQIEKEIEVLTKYLDLQKLRFDTKFVYNINLANFDDLELYHIPPMLLQPFVENAIKHGFRNIDYLGKIDVFLILNGNFIHCLIKDNGCGISSVDNKAYSASIKLIQEIVLILSKSNVKFKSIKPNGTEVSFKIPYRIK